MNKSTHTSSLESSNIGYARHKVLQDDNGLIIDFITLEANSAFSALTGIKKIDLINKKGSKSFCSNDSAYFYELPIYGKIPKGSENLTGEFYSDALRKWFKIDINFEDSLIFNAFFTDITAYKTYGFQEKTSKGNLNTAQLSKSVLPFFSEDQHELREELSILNFIIEGSNLGTWVFNISSEEYCFNKILADITGYNPEDISPADIELWESMVHPDDFKKSMNRLYKCIRGKSDYYESEFRIKHKKGYWVWFLSQGRVLSHCCGNPHKMYGTLTDISKRKEAEEELQKSEEKFRSFVENANDIIFTLSTNGICTYISPNCKDIIGSYPSESMGKNIKNFIHKDDRNKFFSFMNEVLKTGKKHNGIEYRVKHSDGIWRWHTTSGSPVKDKNGKIISFLGIARDVTQHKRDVQNLNEAKEQFELAVKGSNDGIWDWDLRDNSLYLSPKCKEQLGFKANELLNNFSTFEDRLHPDDKNRTISNLTEYLEGKRKKYDIEFRLLHKNGDFRWIRARGETLRDKSGMPYRMAGSTTDITNQREMSNQLWETNKRLEASIQKSRQMAVDAQLANAAKSEFLANMSHEIRTPLNAVTGFADLLMHTEINKTQKQYINNINVSGRALLEIINDILDFSKIEAGKLELELLESDIIDLLGETMDIVNIQASNKGIDLILNTIPSIPRFCRIDTVRLKQILINLLNNAVKFTDKGEVELELGFIKTGYKKGRYSFSVKDSGIGISSNEKTRLFKAFSQADSTTTRKFGGTGLGLIISNMLAEKMGGKITVESTPGKGSIFSFSIETDFKYLPDQKETEKLDIESVLIVDDSKTNRTVLENNFIHWGIKVINRQSGYGAIDLLENYCFDLIIIDYHMPLMDGIETVKYIRENNLITSQTQVILLHRSPEDQTIRSQCKKLGISVNMVKPVKPDRLYNFIKILGKSEYKDDYEEISFKNDEKKPEIKTSGSKPRILIAEDSEMNMILARAAIHRLEPETEIIEATNGKEAVEAYEQYNIDLILMDLQMPEMDGLEAARKIREKDRIDEIHTPIIALTAGALKEEKEKAIESGMDDFFTKPFDYSRLLKVLKNYLPESSGHDIKAEKNNKETVHFDLDELLYNLSGNYEIKNKLIKNCRTEIPKTINDIENLAKNQNPADILPKAHLLKGQAGNMRLKKLAETVCDLETAAQKNNMEQLPQLVSEIKKEWEIIKKLADFK
ncbi:MAG: PAS domain-containing protein [Thermodesulfobacteriota bacterium]